MVAKVAWSSVEPRVCLSDYLASEEPRFDSPLLNWVTEEGHLGDDEQEVRHIGDDSLEIE